MSTKINILQDTMQILPGKQEKIKENDLYYLHGQKTAMSSLGQRDKLLNNVKSYQFMMIVTLFNVVLNIDQSYSFVSNRTIVN